MASSVVDTSSLFVDDESWHKDPGGLDAIAEFNASYDTSQNNGTVDPQLTFSNPQMPMPSHSNPSMNPPTSTTGLSQTLSPDPTVAYSEYPPDIFSQGLGSPYFHQTIEFNPPQQYFPSPLRNMQNLHRRSVSEPPGQQQHQQSQHLQHPVGGGGGRGGGGGGPGMIFHRENHYLGDPIPKTRPMPLKSQTRTSNRQPRQHPYSRPKSSQQQQQQYSQRGQTIAPTSMPFSPPQHQQNQQQQQQQQQMFASMPSNMMMSHMPLFPDSTHYAPSRLCTPASETPSPSLRRQVKVDPSLTGGSAATAAAAATGSEVGKNSIVVSVSVEELRELIFESVRRAVVAEKTEKEGVVMGEEDASAVVSREE